MFCEKCGKEIKDNVKFCPFCGNKVSEKVESRQAVQKQTSKETKKKKWLWMVGVAVILAAGGGIALGLNQNPKPQSDPQAATAKNEKAVENKDTKEEANGIQNAEEAQAWLVEQKEELGLENALSELKETSTAEVSGDHYYRFEQNYEGIPVYGRAIVVAVDQDGNVASVTGNATDVAEDLNLTPSITKEQAVENIQQYASETLGMDEVANLDEINLNQENLCVYNMNDTMRLAYRIPTESYQFLVDANQAEVLEAVPELYEESVIYTDTNGQQEIEGTDPVDGYYVLKDQKRNIYMYDAGGQTYMDPASGLSYPEVLQQVRSKDTIFGNEDDTPQTSAEVYSDLNTIGSIYDYFLKKHKENGWGVLAVVSNDELGAQQGNNAAAGVVDYKDRLADAIQDYDENAYQGKIGWMDLGTAYLGKGTESLDVIAHEYTHIITRKYAKWSSGNRETGAINEGISDIFGEILAEAVGDGADWEMGNRIIHNPYENGYPRSTGANEILPNDRINVRNKDGEESQTDYAHGYSTVISYTAYLMKNGLNESGQGQLSWEELSELWYRVIVMMTSDCDFAQCRAFAEYAADAMEELTEEQRILVKRAFDVVEIFDAEEAINNIEYDIKPGSTLRVYDKNQDYYSGYVLKIMGISGEEKILEDRKVSLRHQYNKEIQVKEAGPYELNLPNGIYHLTISNPDRNGTYSFVVKVEENGSDDAILVSTDYEPPMIVNITDEPVKYKEELYDEVFQEYRDATDAYIAGGTDAISGKFLYIDDFLISHGWQIWYGYYDIDGNGIPELLISYETITGTEYKTVDVLSQDGKSVQRVGEDDTFSAYTESHIYTSGVIYSDAGDQGNYYKINANGYSLEKTDCRAELGENIIVVWKPLELTQNDSVQDDTSSDENVMSAEEVYQKLEEHYAQGTIDSPGEDLAVMEGSVNGTTYSTTVRCGMPGNPSASQALYEVSVDMVTGIASQTRMLLPDGKVEQFSLRDN